MAQQTTIQALYQVTPSMVHVRWGHVGSFGLVIVQLSVNSAGNARPPQGVPAGCDALQAGSPTKGWRYQ